MNKLATALLAGASVFALYGEHTFAQQATLVTRTATVNAPSALGVSSVGNTTACNNTAENSSSDAVTITPGSNQYVYLTGVYLDIVPDATGESQTGTASLTNMPGSPSWSIATVIPTVGNNGSARQISETYMPPIRSQTAGTAVTFTMSANRTHLLVCPRITYYIAQ